MKKFVSLLVLAGVVLCNNTLHVHGMNKNTELREPSQLHIAAMNGELDKVIGFLENGESLEVEADINASCHGYTALYGAIWCDQTLVVQYLLRFFPGLVNQRNSIGLTPLHVAAIAGNTAMAWVLIQHGANIFAVTDDAPEGSCEYGRYTVLQCAAEHNQADMVRFLLALPQLTIEPELMTSFVNYGDDTGWTALHHAAQNGNLDIADELVRHHANVRQMNSDGCTPLHIAAEFDNADMVQFLLRLAPDVVNQKDTWFGWAPMHYAAQNGNMDIANMLIWHGADINIPSDGGAADYADDVSGNTPLHYAARENCLDMVRFLTIECGAETNSVNNDNLTPLGLAISDIERNYSALSAYRANYDTVKFLILNELGSLADIDAYLTLFEHFIHRGHASPLEMEAHRDILRFLEEKNYYGRQYNLAPINRFREIWKAHRYRGARHH